MSPQTATLSSSATQWHRLLAALLDQWLTPVGIEVSTNVEVMSQPPEADIVLLRREGLQWTEAQKARLPDGIRDSRASHILMEFKYTESFNIQAARQALGYDYFYQRSRQLTRHALQTVVVSARTPRQATLRELGYECAEHPGVYRSRSPLLADLLLLVSNELSETPHNRPVICFASRRAVKERALVRLSAETRHLMPPPFQWFLEGLLTLWRIRQGEEEMEQRITVTPEMVTALGKDMLHKMLSIAPMEDVLEEIPYEKLLKHLSLEERLQGLGPEERLQGLGPEERLQGLGPEERLQGLTREEIERYLAQLPQ